MKNSSPDTMLLLTRDRVVRADLRAGRASGEAEIHEERSLAADDLPSQAEAALRLGKRRPGRVWILAGEIWTQTLPLPLEATAGLSADDVTRALGFEAEPFSGLGAVDAAIAALPLPGDGRMKHFWLTELPAAQLEQIEFCVRKAGGRLMAISHAGGLPARLDGAAGASWRRVELWPGAIIAVHGSADGASSVAIINAAPKPGRWLDDAATIEPHDAAMPTQWLSAAPAVPMEELPAPHALGLSDRSALERFFIAWADHIASGPVAAPRIVPPKRPMSAGRRRSISIAIGAAALVVCLLAQLLADGRAERVAGETKRLRTAAAALAKLKADNGTSQARCDELKKSRETLEVDTAHCRRVLLAQRQRLVTLLTVLARQEQDGLLLRKIDGAEDEIVVHGLCLEAQLADNLASALASALAPLGPEGWQVQPPTRQSKEMLVGGGPWEFEVHIQDAEANAPPAPRGAVSLKAVRSVARK